MKAYPPPAPYPFWLIVFVTGSGTLAIHAFVPALPMIAADFGVSAGSVQLVISAYMLSLAFGQVIYGPLSDRFGRRPVLIAGLCLYATASIAAALAPNLATLIVARMLQAFGGCAGLTLGRAVIQDTAKDYDAVARMASVNNFILLSPAAAPIIGQWLAAAFDWRAIPLALSLMGWCVAAGTILWLRETSAIRIANFTDLFSGYLALLRRPRFLAYVAGGALCTTPQFALLTASPFIVTGTLGRPAWEVSLFYIVFIAGIISGGLVSRSLVRRMSFERLLAYGSAVAFMMAASLLVQGLTGTLTVPGFIIPSYLFTVCVGLLSPLTLTRAVSESGTMIGSATGLFGCAQMLTASASVVFSGLGGSIFVSTALVLCVTSTLGISALAFAVLSARAASGPSEPA